MDFGKAKIHGIWRVMPSPMVTELLAQSGLDFQILDCEHGAYDYATLLPDILACENHGCAPWVRVSGTDKVEVQRCLDLGAHGLVFPQLATCADFERAAAMMDYAPDGIRGFNPFVRACGYGVPAAAGTVSGRPWFIPIVETLSALEEIESIVRLPRVDMIYIGGYDLSAALGRPGKMDDPELLRVMGRIIDVCGRAGKRVGSMALTPAASRDLSDRGVQCIVHGVETHRIRQIVSSLIDPLQNHRNEASPSASKS